MSGRPRIEISADDWEKAEKMAHIQGTRDEISYILGISNDTLERRLKERGYDTFGDWYKKYSAGGKMSLRRKQHELALSGNCSMLIWLGKQYLGQKDKQPDEVGDTVINNHFNASEIDVKDRVKIIKQIKGAM